MFLCVLVSYMNEEKRLTTIHVSKNDPAAFHTLQKAVLSIDDHHDERVRIEVAPGIYEEKVFIRKENIEIVGENSQTTVFRYGDGAKKPRPDGSGEYGTFNTAVIFIAGKDITLRNLTIESTAVSSDGRTRSLPEIP